jgi:transketolase
MEYSTTTPATDPSTATAGGDAVDKPGPAHGTTRKRRRTVSYEQIERAACELMAAGERPTVLSVRKAIGRGSPNHITSDLQRFWKNQAALHASDPAALKSLPPELADAARAQWQMALLLAQQAAQSEDTAARAQLEQLKRENDLRARSMDLREKEWDLTARDRERALTDTRALVNELMKTLAIDREVLQERESRIADLESQIDEYRRQFATVIASAIAKNQALTTSKPRHQIQSKRKNSVMLKQRSTTQRTKAPTKR